MFWSWLTRQKQKNNKSAYRLFQFTGDNHEEVFLTGGSLGQILHDVPVALDQLLHLVRLSVAVLLLLLSFLLVFIIAALLFSLPSFVFLLFGSFLKNRAVQVLSSVFCFFSLGVCHIIYFLFLLGLL